MKEAIQYYKKCLARRRGASLLLTLFGVTFLGVSLHLFLQRRPSGGMIALLYLLIFLVLPLVEEVLHLKLPLLAYALIFFLTFGSLLGGNYNFYLRIPFWDTALHALAGLLFSFVGYALCKLLFPIYRSNSIFPYILAGFIFSLSIALLWELFEAGITAFMLVDMQEDTLVHHIKSFYLSGTHDYPVHLQGITETVIYYGEGQILRIPGYLDLGLADTVADMAVCLLGNLAFLLLFPLDKFFRGRLLPFILPKIL